MNIYDISIQNSFADYAHNVVKYDVCCLAPHMSSTSLATSKALTEKGSSRRA